MISLNDEEPSCIMRRGCSDLVVDVVLAEIVDRELPAEWSCAL